MEPSAQSVSHFTASQASDWYSPVTTYSGLSGWDLSRGQVHSILIHTLIPCCDIPKIDANRS